MWIPSNQQKQNQYSELCKIHLDHCKTKNKEATRINNNTEDIGLEWQKSANCWTINIPLMSRTVRDRGGDRTTSNLSALGVGTFMDDPYCHDKNLLS